MPPARPASTSLSHDRSAGRAGLALSPALLGAALVTALLLSSCHRSPSENDRQCALSNTRYGQFSDRVTGLDPAHDRSGAATIAINIYETLYQYHYLKRPYEVVPCLAAEMPEVSEDGRRYAIRLRDDVRFEDDACFADGKGRPLVARDFIYSWKRIANPHEASPSWFLFEGRIEGLDGFRAEAKALPREQVDLDRLVSGLRAVNDRTLEIRLVRPWPQILYALTQLPTAAVAREAVERYGDTFRRHPVGTGPFRLESWRQDVRIVLERNPNFRGEPYPSKGEPGDAEVGLLRDAGKPMPFLDHLDFHFVRAAQPTWLLFLQGKFDYHGVPGYNYDEVIGPGRALTPEMVARGVQLYLFRSSFSRWIGVNMADPLIGQNRPLRRAVSLALDRPEFNEAFQTGRGDLPTGLLPPAFKEADPSRRCPWIVTDPARARAELRRAEKVHGHPLPPLRMLLQGRASVHRQVGQLLERNFALAGIRLEIISVDEGVDLRRVLKERGAQLFFGIGYRAASPDAADLFRRFLTRNIERGLNPFGYSNPDFDALYEQTVTLPDGPRRVVGFRKLEDLLLWDLPAIPYLDYNHFYVTRDWLLNCKPHAFYGPSSMAKYHRVDTALRLRRLEQR